MAKGKKKRGCGCFTWILIIVIIALVIGALGGNDEEKVVDEEIVEESTEEETVEEVEEPEDVVEGEVEVVEEVEDEPKVIELDEELHFSEFTLTFERVKIEDNKAEVKFLFRNDSWKEGLHFSRAAGLSVSQGDARLEEVDNDGVLRRHDVGIETPIYIEYDLANTEDDLVVHVHVWMYEDVEEDAEFIVEIEPN